MAEENSSNQLVPSLGGRPRRQGPPGGGPRDERGKFAKRTDTPKKHWLSKAKVNDPQYEFPLIKVVDELVDKYDLTKQQALFLVMRPTFSNDADTARALGLSPHVCNSWRFNGKRARRVGQPNPDFRGAEDELYDRIKEAAQRKFNSMAFKVATRTDELLDAEKPIITKVKTGEGIEEIINYEPDYDARFKGIQAASRWLGEWGTESKVVQNTQYVSVMDQFGRLMTKVVEEKVVEGSFRKAEEEDDD